MKSHASADIAHRFEDMLPPAMNGPGIGEPLESLRSGLTRLAGRLQPLLSQAEREQVSEIASGLSEQRCKVAVLGQVKAGKSSLVNALTRRPNLSPTDINPWTAVVCHLNFGVPAEPLARAVFTFFDEADWTYLASGGRLRELSERLGVELDGDLLREQTAQTRTRAEQRLGRQFQLLLGQQHRFAQPSGDLLSRYVSVGHGMEAYASRREAAAGRYSDVTKSAELFFDRPPFGYPMTIIDTPGTNDPFLVRDDLTGRAIDDADVNIVVLTADQALSSADLAMLRMLHGLHKQRMIVFVNRIDVLDDIAVDTVQVVDYVRRQLAVEFPSASIPVIAGSAIWAELALRSGEMPSAAELPAALKAHAGYPAGTEAVGEDVDQTEARADMIMKAAGITDLEATIDRLLLRGPSMLALQRAFDQQSAIHRSVEGRLSHDRMVLGEAIELAREEETSAEQRREEIDRQLDRIRLVPRELSEVAMSSEEQLRAIKAIATERLQTALSSVVASFAESEGEALRKASLVSDVAPIWQCDTRALRQQLEVTFLDAHRAGTDDLLVVEGNACRQLETVFNQLMPDKKIKMKHGRPSMADPAPSIGALGRTVALDLGNQWARWWYHFQRRKARIKRLQQLVRSEFEPIVDDLVATAETELTRQMQDSLDRFKAVKHDLSTLLDKRRQRLEELSRKIIADDKAVPMESLVARHETRLEKTTADLRLCEQIGQDVQQLSEASAALLSLASLDHRDGGPGRAAEGLLPLQPVEGR